MSGLSKEQIERMLRDADVMKSLAKRGYVVRAAKNAEDVVRHVKALAAEVERLRQACSMAVRKLSCVSIERMVNCVPEILRECDRQAIEILLEALHGKEE